MWFGTPGANGLSLTAPTVSLVQLQATTLRVPRYLKSFQEHTVSALTELPIQQEIRRLTQFALHLSLRRALRLSNGSWSTTRWVTMA